MGGHLQRTGCRAFWIPGAIAAVLWLQADPNVAAAGNHPPALTPLADYPIPAGTRERLAIEATDVDGDPLTFRMVQGPSFVAVQTIDSGHGVARGQIDVAPDSCGRGDVTCVIAVTDDHTADVDTMVFRVRPLARRLPPEPMVASPEALLAFPPSWRNGPMDSMPLVGEWEWHLTSGRIVPLGPDNHGFRERAVFHPDGRLDLYELGPDRIIRSIHATYRLEDRHRLVVSQWFTIFGMGTGPLSLQLQIGPRYFEIYPGGVTDAYSDQFVRVPAVLGESTAQNAKRLITPIQEPVIGRDHGREQVLLSERMRAAIQARDPDFRLWTDEEGREMGHGLQTIMSGPSAIQGDFDGDLLPDVALLGRSGADQVVLAVLSRHGNLTAVEVCWRKVRVGEGAHRTRGDPRHIPPVYLDLAPRGTRNPFCGSAAIPRDGIGIVVPGGVRFDYLFSWDRTWSSGTFGLFAPLP